MKLFGGRKTKHRYLRRVVLLCLVMMTLITAGEYLLAWRTGEQVSDAALGVLASMWCSELLMSLLKRRHDDKKDKKEPTSEDDGEEGSI